MLIYTYAFYGRNDDVKADTLDESVYFQFLPLSNSDISLIFFSLMQSNQENHYRGRAQFSTHVLSHNRQVLQL